MHTIKKWILSRLAGLIALLWTAILGTIGVLTFPKIQEATTSKAGNQILLLVAALAITGLIYVTMKWYLSLYENPRGFAYFVAKGGFWKHRFNNTLYCGKCMTKGKRSELKFNSGDQWECLECATIFSPHEKHY